MPAFAYTAVAADGARRSGTVEAADRIEGVRRLAADGLRIVAITEATAKGGTNRKVEARRTRSTRSGKTDPARLLADLALLLDAGLPFAPALRALSAEGSDPALAAALERITAGGTVADALGELPGLPPEAWPVLAAGERGGRLGTVLKLLADDLAARAERRAALRDAMVYPAFLLIVMLGAVLVMTFVLVPSVAPIFEGAGTEPPLVVALLTGLGDALRGPMAPGALAACAAVAWLVSRRAGGLAHRLPGIGPLVLSLARARTLRTLSLLLGNGVPVTEALALAGDAAHPADQGAMRGIGRAVAGGDRLPAAMGESALFEPRVLALASVGDEANALPGTLAKAADLLDTEARRRIDAMLALLTPAITIGMGFLVGWLVVSVLTALLGMNELAV